MNDRLQLFEEIRTRLVNQEDLVSEGKMMSTQAIKYDGKVFVFIAKNGNMVFKFGKDFDPEAQDFEATTFNPFKNKRPLAGWFEVSYSQKELWESLTIEALSIIKQK